MELTIDQALQKAVEAHKAGKVQEADRLYTAILKAQPKHPDANHNLGVLAVSVGKVEPAIPFFKTALEANPKIAQFWLSYIDALIKEDRLTDAKVVLDQAKSKGAKGDGLDRLEQRLKEANKEYPLDDVHTETIEIDQNSTLDIAVQLIETGKFNQAVELLKDAIKGCPEDVDMLALLSRCYLLADKVDLAKLYLEKATSIAPYNASVGWNTARLLLKEQIPSEAVNVARKNSQRFPDDVEGMGVLGACLRANAEPDESLEILNKALSLNPDFAEALINRGLIRLSQENKPEAMADLELAHRLKPHIKQIWDLVVGLKLEVQEYTDAILLLINMIEIDPGDAKRLATLALCYQQIKDFEASEEFNKKALAIKPDYAEAYNNMGNALKAQGKLEEAIASFNQALSLKPDSAETYCNMGITLKEQGKLEEAIEAYKKALAIKLDYVQAYYNMGNALKEHGKIEEAIEAYKKALNIKPDYADAYNNMGVTLQEQGKLEEAIEAYNKTLAIKPDYADAYNNMGNTLQEQGKLEEAIEAYKKALNIKPDYADAVDNSQSLLVQLLPILGIWGYDYNIGEVQTNSKIVLRPRYQIHNVIKAYLEADFVQAKSHNDMYKTCDHHLLDGLELKNKVFCSVYSSFVEKLLDAQWDEEHASENTLYHLGESHSLSYAHRNITIGDSNFRITPRITFGAKAFHFSRNMYDKFTAITKAHFASLPKNSKVFLSFGEIDCRPNEGFISAAGKLHKSLEELIDQTTSCYVEWFSEQNKGKEHHLYFINVPAPVYDEKLTTDLNSEVARTVALFNAALNKYSQQHGFDTVDVFKFTAGKKGFSNGLFHIDGRHLGAKALPEIERQLS